MHAQQKSLNCTPNIVQKSPIRQSHFQASVKDFSLAAYCLFFVFHFLANLKSFTFDFNDNGNDNDPRISAGMLQTLLKRIRNIPSISLLSFLASNISMHLKLKQLNMEESMETLTTKYNREQTNITVFIFRRKRSPVGTRLPRHSSGADPASILTDAQQILKTFSEGCGSMHSQEIFLKCY